MSIMTESRGSNANRRGFRRGTGVALACALLTFVFGGPWCAFAQQVPVTPGVHVDRAGNGVPVVNIAAPNGQGVSHNQYQQFDVDRAGVILNNARGVSATQLGGHIEGNPNLAPDQSARIILNEVTSTHPSALRGFTEVAGSRAEVVIANPNGITCDGCGFINTSRGVLTTGRPVFGMDGDLNAFQVERGTVRIDGAGLNATGADRVDLLARAMELNAKVWAGDLYAILGTNRIDYNDGTIQIQAVEGETPRFALDLAALGGMYANRIFLIGTEPGAGIRNDGEMLAYGAEDFILAAEGRLVLTGRTSAAGNLQISGSEVALSGQQTAGGNIRVRSAGDLISSGTTVAGIDAEGRLGASGDVTLHADGTLTQSGTVLAGDALHVEATALDNTGDLYAGQSMTLQAQQIGNVAGRIHSAGDLQLQAWILDNTGGQLQSGGDLSVHATGVLDNAQGKIVAGRDLHAAADQLHNAAGQLAAQRQLQVQLQTLTGDGGRLFGHERAGLTFLGDYTHDGRQSLLSNGALMLDVAGTLTNTDALEAYGALQIQATHLDNRGRLSSGNPSGTGLTEVQAERIDNAGRIDGDHVELVASDVHNTGTVIGRQVMIEAERLVNGRDLGTALAPVDYGEGLIAAGRHLELRISERLDNLDAELHSAGTLTMTGHDGARTGVVANRSGRIQAADTLTIAADAIFNERRVFETVWHTLDEAEQATNQTTYAPVSRYRYDDTDPSHQPPNVEPWRVVSAEEIAQADAVCAQNGWERERCFGWRYGRGSATTFQSVTTDTLLAIERLLQRASAEGQILGGGDLVIDTGHLLNATSTVAAGGNLIVNAQPLSGDAGGVIENRAWSPRMQIGRGTALEVQSQYLVRNPRHWIPGVFWHYGEHWESFEQAVDLTNPPVWITLDPGTAVAATLSARGQVDLSARTIDNHSVGRSDEPPPQFQWPSLTPPGGLYREVDEAARWRIETDPRLTDYGQWLGSDYLLDRLGIDPEGRHRRLGDDYYETQLVLNQIAGLTGRRYLGEPDALAQYRALMDAGVEIAGAFHLMVGIALTAEQLAALDRDIVWLVAQEVDGEEVLVPVVYLSQASTERFRLEGAQIVANTVRAEASETLVNRGGAIRADSDVVLQAQDLLNDGGVIGAGDRLTLLAGNDLVNRNGRIEGNDVALEAGRDVRIVTEAGPLGATQAEVIAGSALAVMAGRDIDLERARLQAGTASAGLTPPDTGSPGDIALPPPLLNGTLDLHAGRDLVVTASEVQAEGDLVASAGRDVHLTSTVQTLRDVHDGNPMRRETTQDIDATVFEAGGDLQVVAGRDLHLTAARLQAGMNPTASVSEPAASSLTAMTADAEMGASDAATASGTLVLIAGRDLTSTTLTTTAASREQSREGRRVITEATRDETAHGSDVSATGDIVWQAGQDLTLQATQVRSEAGGLELAAGRDIALTTAQEQHEATRHTREKRSGSFSSTTTTTHDETHASWVVGTMLSGETVDLIAGRDLSTQAAQVAATGDILLAAGRDLTLDTGRNTVEEQHEYRRKKSGLSGGGAGFSVGSQSLERDSDVVQVTHSSSLVGSLEGRVDLVAGNEVTVRGSEVLGETGVGIAGANVTIEGVENTLSVQEEQRFRQSGFSASLKGGAVDAAVQAVAHLDRAGDVEDDRLAALHAVQGARDLINVGQGVSAVASGQIPANAGMSLRIGIGASRSTNTADLQETTIQGSRISSNSGDVTIAATGHEDGNGGDLSIYGSTVAGRNVTLAAAHDLRLQSQQETSRQHTENKASGGSVGVTIGSEAGLGVYASAHQARGHSDGASLSHAETQVSAGDTLTLISGHDTTLQGAQTRGETVIARIGGDLTLVSEQDTHTFDRQDHQSGFDVAAGTGGGRASGYLGKTDIESNYRSVNEQTGIEAGTGGFDIEVDGHTELVGAAIASAADPDNNRLSTGSLSARDLENAADYRGKTMGISGGISWNSGASGGVSPGLGIPASDDAHSTTRSGIARGTVEIRDGDATTLAHLDRDVTELQNTGLTPIFDEQEVQEQLELGQIAGLVGFQAAGDLARGMGWEEGSREKVILHGAVGAAVAALGGGDALQGLAGAAANQLAFNAVHDYLTGQGVDPNSHEFATYMQLASLAIGAAMGDGSGAATALWGEQFNRQLHPDEIAFVRDDDRVARYAEQFGVSEEQARQELMRAAAAMTDKSWNDALAAADWEVGQAQAFIRNELMQYQNSPLFQVSSSEYENHRLGLKELLTDAVMLGYTLDYLALVNPATYKNDPRYTELIAQAKGDGSTDGFVAGLRGVLEGLSHGAMFGMNAAREPGIALDHLRGMWEDFTFTGAEETLQLMQGNIYGAVYDFQNKTTATGVALGTAWGATRLMRDYAGAVETPSSVTNSAISSQAGKYARRTDVDYRLASEVNAAYPEGWTPPYKSGTRVTEYTTVIDDVYVRVHGENNMARSWMMRREAIEGLTAEQIQMKYSLPELPLFMSEVHVPAGTRVRTGIVNPAFNGIGNAIQYELLQRLPESAFKNTVRID
ncbi:MAG: hemagglutinin repeat-containing protein [Xanthomonadaceae bacterium]|jgi:filamentous hemagglutinin|nr:hemagglutinin repeat-containing protein [Xanthomonadaceae bacterium]